MVGFFRLSGRYLAFQIKGPLSSATAKAFLKLQRCCSKLDRGLQVTELLDVARILDVDPLDLLRHSLLLVEQQPHTD